MDTIKNIFKAYDIKGLYEKELTLHHAYLIGRAFGTISDGVVIVGHDSRTSSNALNTNLIKGLVETGVKVIDIGLVTTPILYYAREFFGNPYAIMITGSDYDKDYNGFILCDNQGIMYDEKMGALFNIIATSEFKEGVGSVEPYDLTYDYKKLMMDKITLGEKRLKVVIDCSNGVSSCFNPSIIKDWGVDVIEHNCDIKNDLKENITSFYDDGCVSELKDKVIEENADLGVLFDDDGDRILLIDENGQLIKNDMLMLIIWKSIYRTCRNKTASFDVKCSSVLKKQLESLGLRTEYNKEGSAYLNNKVKEYNYDFAGEMSGHLCFNDDFYGYDDALYALGRLLKILSNINGKISNFFNDVPKYASSLDNFISVPNQRADLIINKILNYAKVNGYEIIDIDGIRIEYTDGFALIKKSNTSPGLIVSFEGSTKEIMESYRLEIMKIINEEL